MRNLRTPAAAAVAIMVATAVGQMCKDKPTIPQVSLIPSSAAFIEWLLLHIDRRNGLLGIVDVLKHDVSRNFATKQSSFHV